MISHMLLIKIKIILQVQITKLKLNWERKIYFASIYELIFLWETNSSPLLLEPQAHMHTQGHAHKYACDKGKNKME